MRHGQLTNLSLAVKVTHLLGERLQPIRVFGGKPPKVYPKNSQANGLAGDKKTATPLMHKVYDTVVFWDVGALNFHFLESVSLGLLAFDL